MPSGVYIRTEAHKVAMKAHPMMGDNNPSRRPEVRLKISLAKKGKPSLKQRGENHWNWKGGVTPKNQKIRVSIEYKNWRRSVFERDDYRCLDCGERGKKLNADHIFQFAYYPRLRFDINNGQTLCEDCHRKTPTYASKSLRPR